MIVVHFQASPSSLEIFANAIDIFFAPQIPAASGRNHLLTTFALLGTVFFVTARLNVSYAGID